jgi:molecular chaperone DnaJ
VRNGFDLHVELPVSFKTAALGGVVKVPTIDETFDFTVPEGTQSGQVFTVRGKGIRSARGNVGNLILKIVVEVPTKLSKEQKRAIENMEKGIDLKQHDKMKRYSDNVESFYGKKPY